MLFCYLICSLNVDSFMPQQPAFSFQSPTKAREMPVGPHHPMARKNNRQRVRSDCIGDGSNCFGPPDRGRNLPVASGFTVWDLAECVPYLPLKRSALDIDIEAKELSLAVEVRADLVGSLGQR